VNDIRPPRSLRWRLPLIAACVVLSAVFAFAPGLLPASQHETMRGMAAGMASVFAVVLLVLAVPAARRTYFQLLETRESGCARDRRVAWLSWAAVALYVATLVLARWAVPHAATPATVIGLGVLPLLAMGLYTAAMVLHLRQLDELMRKIEMESWAWAALVVAQAYFAAWVLLKAGVVHVDASNALLWLGVWLLIVRTGFYVRLMRKYL